MPRMGRFARAWLFPIKHPRPANPALLKHAEERAAMGQNRLADRITAFSGSMAFVYLHLIWFACWIGFGLEKYPFGLLTMIVSLEAIFLSTFVLISQNRADAKRQVLADEEWKTVQEEDHQNRELLRLSNEEEKQNEQLLAVSNQILALTKEVHRLAEKARVDNEQNKELLDLSRRTLALTKEVHANAATVNPTDSGFRAG
jgi:uncharacterized membrane protein